MFVCVKRLQFSVEFCRDARLEHSPCRTLPYNSLLSFVMAAEYGVPIQISVLQFSVEFCNILRRGLGLEPLKLTILC